MINKRSSDEKNQSLSHISEHDTEDQGVCDSHKQSRIKLIMCRQPVHLHKHLKWFEKLRILQLCRRLSKIRIMVIFHNYKDLIVILNLFYKLIHIVFCHPAAENIIIFFIIFHSCGQLTDIKVIGEFFQTIFGCDKLRRPVGKHFPCLLIQIAELPGDLRVFPVQRTICLLWRSLKLILEFDSLKMERPEYSVHFLRFRRRNKIRSVHVAFVPLPFHKNRSQVIQQIFLHFLIKFNGNAPEAVGNIFVVQHLMKIAVQRTERSDNSLFCVNLLAALL